MIKPFYEADGVGGGAPPAPVTTPAAEPTAEPTGGVQNIMEALDSAAPATPPAEPAPAAEPTVPEQYTFNLGEGLTISDEQQARLTEIAKSANMTQETVDALLEMHSNIMLDTIRQAEDQKNGWVKECHEQGLADKVHLGYAKKCLDTFGGDKATQVLVDTGAINHPEVQRMLQRIGALISEDTGATGGGNPTPKPLSDAEIMFPNSKY